ncbi:MAG: DNA repair exonuclease [Spirochaetota bacterium]|nr:DNA repair exonuclease [Spirochaetota bacterium]
MIKILLTSDIHLGHRNDDFYVSEDARMKTFKRITSLAKEHDLLLIGGDLFDYPNIGKELIDFVAEEFQNIRDNDVEIVYTLGENELYEDGSIPNFLLNLNTNHLFSRIEHSPYCFSKKNQQVFIYGSPSRKIDFSQIRRKAEGGFHIGLFHVNFVLNDECIDSNISTLHRRDIKSLDLDFYALGHYHHFKVFKSMGRIIAAYPGSPEATSFGEKGDRSVLSIIVDDNEISQIKMFTVNSTIVNETFIDCCKPDAHNTLCEVLENNKSFQTIIKIILFGKRDFNIDSQIIEGYEREYLKILVEDNSYPSIDLLIKEFENENSLRGEFFSILKERIAQKEMPPDIDLMNLSEILHHTLREETLV